MKISATKKYVTSDFPQEVQAWIAKLTAPLNAIIEQVVQAINSGLTVKDNLKSQTFSINVSAGQIYPIKQAYTLNEKPNLLLKGSLRESTGATPSTAIDHYWQLVNGNLEITMIGLNPAKAYTINFTALV